MLCHSERGREGVHPGSRRGHQHGCERVGSEQWSSWGGLGQFVWRCCPPGLGPCPWCRGDDSGEWSYPGFGADTHSGPTVRDPPCDPVPDRCVLRLRGGDGQRTGEAPGLEYRRGPPLQGWSNVESGSAEREPECRPFQRESASLPAGAFDRYVRGGRLWERGPFRGRRRLRGWSWTDGAAAALQLRGGGRATPKPGSSRAEKETGMGSRRVSQCRNAGPRSSPRRSTGRPESRDGGVRAASAAGQCSAL